MRRRCPASAQAVRLGQVRPRLTRRAGVAAARAEERLEQATHWARTQARLPRPAAARLPTLNPARSSNDMTYPPLLNRASTFALKWAALSLVNGTLHFLA